MKLIWETADLKYSNGSVYRAGKYGTIVGATVLGLGNKSEPNAPLWAANIALPGIKKAPERFHTEAEAKADVERRIAKWFEWMGVETK